MSKPSRTAAKRRADQAFSRYIRARDKRCQVCQEEPAGQCGHVFSRAYLAVRYDERNALGICSSCHLRMTHHPLEWQVFVEENVPEWQRLRWLAVNHVTEDGTPSNKIDYAAIARYFEEAV